VGVRAAVVAADAVVETVVAAMTAAEI